MKLESSVKLSNGRSVEPEETVRRLSECIGRRYEYLMHEEQLSEHLHWSALFIDDLEFRAMGKGTRAIDSRAGALAEAAEWIASREIDQLPGYRMAHEGDL